MRAARPRAGFTLIEILVVVGIIAILASLTAAGIFQVIEGQRQANTETTMRMVAKLLQSHVKAVLEKANKESIPQNVIAMAGNDPRRARVIWKKLRLKQEFPMSFLEASDPNLYYGAPPPPPPPPLPSPSALTPADLPSLYKKALATLPATGNFNSSTKPFQESAACLLLALKQSRGGATALSPDELGSGAIDVNGDGLKEIVDGWGNPMAFFRFPTATGDPATPTVADELNGLNPATPGSTASKFRDPIDPEGTLMNPAWLLVLDPKTTKYVLTPAAAAFEALCHKISKLNTVTGNVEPFSCYMMPVLASSGRNGSPTDHKWGLAFALPPMIFNPDLTPDPPRATDGDDNIYSFRLRGD